LKRSEKKYKNLLEDSEKKRLEAEQNLAKNEASSSVWTSIGVGVATTATAIAAFPFEAAAVTGASVLGVMTAVLSLVVNAAIKGRSPF